MTKIALRWAKQRERAIGVHIDTCQKSTFVPRNVQDVSVHHPSPGPQIDHVHVHTCTCVYSVLDDKLRVSLQGLPLQHTHQIIHRTGYRLQAPPRPQTTTLSLKASLPKFKLTLHLTVTTQCADACVPAGVNRKIKGDLIDYPYIHTYMTYGDIRGVKPEKHGRKLLFYLKSKSVLLYFCSHASQTHGRRR